jgi:cytidylate kinase
MYRALTWWVLAQGVDPADQAAVTRLARELPLSIGTSPESTLLTVDGQDLTAAVREPRISAAVSAIATNLDVRAELIRRQRELIAEDDRGIVVEGRDITTVVAPDADARVLLTASEQARLARRALEVHGSDDDAAIAATRDHVVRRDAQDAAVADFLEAGLGVTVIDSSEMSFEETVESVLAVVGRVGADR